VMVVTTDSRTSSFFAGTATPKPITGVGAARGESPAGTGPDPGKDPAS
jgi:hypothetical protein